MRNYIRLNEVCLINDLFIGRWSQNIHETHVETQDRLCASGRQVTLLAKAGGWARSINFGGDHMECVYDEDGDGRVEK